MSRLAPDYLKTEKMCENAVKKLPFIIKYVPDRYETKRMCDKVIIENGGMLGGGLFLTAARVKKCVIKKAVDNYSHSLRFIPGCYKTQKMCDKTVLLIFLQCNLFLNVTSLCS